MAQALIRNIGDDVIEGYKSKARLAGAPLEPIDASALVLAHRPAVPFENCVWLHHSTESSLAPAAGQQAHG